jgi:hypothetical protein
MATKAQQLAQSLSANTYIIDMSASTGALNIPKGNTAQRPAASNGYIRFNTDLNTLEGANNSSWANVGSGIATSGGIGTVSVQNTNFTAVSGYVYPVNTTSSNVTVTLPANPTPGNFITIIDYARTFAANNCLVARNGSNIAGTLTNTTLGTSGSQVTFVYVDSSQGWLQASGNQNTFVGGYSVTYLAVAGGGGSGELGGGGGAGGMTSGTAVVAPGTTYSVVIGAGGNGSQSSMTNGVNTTGIGVTAIGGGYGAFYASAGNPGGSGGGGSRSVGTGGSGTSGQGNPGGFGASGGVGQTAGGGGAGAAGTPYSGSQNGPGGIGQTSSISGSSTYYAGGGGGGGDGTYTRGVGGSGGGANGLSQNGGTASSATSNTGGGGGGGAAAGGSGGSGGSGIFIISYPSPQKAIGGTVTTSGTQTIHTFTTSGTFTA